MDHFGTYLRRQREARGLTLSVVSRATKIPERSLELVEEARLEALPAPVFVRGFVSAYAREVGANEAEALARYRACAAERSPEPEPEAATAPPVERGKLLLFPGRAAVREARGEAPVRPDAAPLSDRAEDPEAFPALERRRVGVVMVVLLVLVVATLTLSLLLGHGHEPGTGLS